MAELRLKRNPETKLELPLEIIRQGLELDINIKQFGAIGDGINDDYGALDKAHNELGILGGRLNYLPGTYIQTREILMQNRSNFIIDGNGATLQMIAGAIMAQGFAGLRLENCSKFVIQNLTIDANRANRTPSASVTHNLFLHGCTDFLIQNVTCINGTTDGYTLRFQQSTTAIAITGATQADPCRVTMTAHGLTTDDIIHITGVGGMTELNDLAYVVTVVDPNTVDLNGVDATGFGAYTTGGSAFTQQYCDNGMFLNCVADNCFRNGMSITSGKNIQIVGGRYDNNTNLIGGGIDTGLDIEPNAADADFATENITVSGASFWDNAGFGINITGKCQYIKVLGCDLKRNDRGGLSLGDTRHVVLGANTLHDFDVSDRGIIDLGNPQDVDIYSNEIRDIETGQACIYSHGTAINVRIRGNTVKNVNIIAADAQGILCFTAGARVTDNVVDNIGGAGIVMSTGCDDSVVAFNLIKATTDSALSLIADRVLADGNTCLDPVMAVKTNGVIRNNTTTGCKIINNSIILSTPDVAVVGIRVLATATPEIVKGNTIEGCGAALSVQIDSDVSANPIELGINPGDHDNTGLGQPTDIASANNLTLPFPFTEFIVTGNTPIRNIAITNSSIGRTVRLEFDTLISLQHDFAAANGSLLLSNLLQDLLWDAQPGDSITLQLVKIGAAIKWHQKSRSENQVNTVVKGAAFSLDPRRPYIIVTSAAPVTSSVTTAIKDGGTIGEILRIINGNAADAITFKDAANTQFTGAADVVLAAEKTLIVWWDGSLWIEQDVP